MAQCFSCQDQGHDSNTWVGNHRLIHTISFQEELSDHFDANSSDASGPSAHFFLVSRAKQTSERLVPTDFPVPQPLLYCPIPSSSQGAPPRQPLLCKETSKKSQRK